LIKDVIEIGQHCDALPLLDIKFPVLRLETGARIDFSL
jgi:hypothetical protein